MRLSFLEPVFTTSSDIHPAVGSGLSLAARVVFALVLLTFFLSSAATKFDGFGLSGGAFMQILPKQMEAASYDPSQIAWHLRLVVFGGALAEAVLPVLVVIGFATRLSSLAMIGFILVMSLTDIYGHGVDAATIGALLDRDPHSMILDQRLLWALVLTMPLALGGGAVSADAVISRLLRPVLKPV